MNETSYVDLAFHSEGKMLEVTWPTVCEKTFGGENVAIERKKERKKEIDGGGSIEKGNLKRWDDVGDGDGG